MLVACNSTLYFTPVRCSLQAKQRLAGATTKRMCGLVDSQPWDFSSITSSLSVLLGHSWDRAHARSETVIEVMTSFPKVYLYFKVTPGIAHMRTVKPILITHD
jgi:hypothetical protein